MAVQLEVVKFRDLVVVSALPRFVPGIVPLTLEVKGEDFTSVEDVFINEEKSPEFLIVDKNTMWVQLPISGQNRIQKIEVISSQFTGTARSKLAFKIGSKSRTVTGVLKLTQLFVKWLLQSPGSDIFSPQRGGGLQELAGKVSTTKRMEPIFASVTRSVSLTTTQIQNAQSALPNLPLNERLLSADILDLDVNSQIMSAFVRISIRTMSGEDARASLQL